MLFYMKTGWTITSIVVPALAGVGFNMVGYTPPEFFYAKLCFIAASGILGVMSVFWVSFTQRKVIYRLVVMLVLMLVIVGGLSWSLSWIGKREIINRTGKEHYPQTWRETEGLHFGDCIGTWDIETIKKEFECDLKCGKNIIPSKCIVTADTGADVALEKYHSRNQLDCIYLGKRDGDTIEGTYFCGIPQGAILKETKLPSAGSHVWRVNIGATH